MCRWFIRRDFLRQLLTGASTAASSAAVTSDLGSAAVDMIDVDVCW